MNDTTLFDPNRRLTLKVIAGGSLLASAPLAAIQHSGAATSTDNRERIDCRLICRNDNTRGYLLLENRNDTDIALARFDTQSIAFDNTVVPLHDAFVEPVIVPTKDRVMVRLDSRFINPTPIPDATPLNFDTDTRFLPQGTRVVALPVSVMHGVGSVSMTFSLV